MKIKLAGAMRRESRRRTAFSLVLLGVRDLFFALCGKCERKETRVAKSSFTTDEPNAALSLNSLTFVIGGLSGRSHALLLPQTPALVSRLFSLTAELSSLGFQFEMSKGSP